MVEPAIVFFIFLIVALVVAYYVFLTRSLVDACINNNSMWIIIFIACYFLALLGLVPLVYYWSSEIEVKEPRKGRFNLASHVIYLLKRQLIPVIIIFAFFSYAAIWASLPAGPVEAFPTIAALLLVFSYSVYLTLLTFTILYVPKVLYLMKEKKPRRGTVLLLSIIPELSRWYLTLLFALEIYKRYLGWAIQINTMVIVVVSLAAATVITLGYRE